jgi:hypothetical protein
MEILKYIYCGKIDLNADNFVQIYKVADIYLMHDLKALCMDSINESNVTKIFSDNAESLESEQLHKACMQLIRDNPFQVFKDEHFNSLSFDAIQKIITSQMWFCSKQDIAAAIDTWTTANEGEYEVDDMNELKTIMFARPYERVYFKPIRYSMHYDTSMSVTLKCMVPTTLFGICLFRLPEGGDVEILVEIRDSFQEDKVLKSFKNSFAISKEDTTQLSQELFFDKIEVSAHEVLKLTFFATSFATVTSRTTMDKRFQIIRNISYEGEIEIPVHYLICRF